MHILFWLSLIKTHGLQSDKVTPYHKGTGQARRQGDMRCIARRVNELVFSLCDSRYTSRLARNLKR